MFIFRTCKKKNIYARCIINKSKNQKVSNIKYEFGQRCVATMRWTHDPNCISIYLYDLIIIIWVLFYFVLRSQGGGSGVVVIINDGDNAHTIALICTLYIVIRDSRLQRPHTHTLERERITLCGHYARCFFLIKMYNYTYLAPLYTTQNIWWHFSRNEFSRWRKKPAATQLSQ